MADPNLRQVKPWWVRYRGLLEYEFQALEGAGYHARLDQAARDDRSVITVELGVLLPGEDERARLIATYPDLYPFFRPEVQAPDLALERHQHPFAHTLCLLARETRHWHSEMTLAQLISEQFPKLLAAVANEGAPTAAEIEENAGEPFSDYYTTQIGASVLIDTSWELPRDVTSGELLVGYDAEGSDRVRAAVLSVYDDAGNNLAGAPVEIRQLYTPEHVPSRSRQTTRARWVRLSEPPQSDDPRDIAQLLEADHADLRRPHRSPLKLTTNRKRSWDLIGLIYPEQIAYEEIADGWVFLARRLDKSNSAKHRFDNHQLVRAWRTGRTDVTERVPSLRPLRSKTALLVGAGAIGAPVALELAKAGLRHLRIFEPDVIDPATASRWPAGVGSAGIPKISWLVQTVGREYPYTQVTARPWKLGRPRIERIDENGREITELTVLNEALDGVDLIIDATAEIGVQHALSTLAWEAGIDYLCLSATAGAWGGTVARVRPDSGGCWSCFQLQLRENGLPPSDPAGTIQPPGCPEPTFTGTSFDLQQVSMTAARLAVATLCAAEPQGYPDCGWDAGTLTLRDQVGNPQPPSWTTWVLDRHSDCESGLHG